MQRHLSHILAVNAMLELALILGGVVIPLGPRYQPISAKRPLFISADMNMFSCPARSGVRTIQRPMELCAVGSGHHFVHGHHHIWEGGHEAPRLLGYGLRRAAIDAYRTAFGIERRYALGVLAAPGLCVTAS